MDGTETIVRLKVVETEVETWETWESIAARVLQGIDTSSMSEKDRETMRDLVYCLQHGQIVMDGEGPFIL